MSDLRLAGLPDNVEAVVLTVANVWAAPELAPGVEPAVKVTPLAVAHARGEAEKQIEEAKVTAARGASMLERLFPGWSVSSEAAADSPGWAIIKRAADWKADLIVVGATGRSGLSRLALGSVSQKIVIEAPCSVRVGRSTGQLSVRPPRVLLALDGSENSRLLIDTVRQRHWPSGTRVRLITAVDEKIITTIFEPPLHLQKWIDSGDEDPLAWVARMLAEYRTSLESGGLHVDTLVNRGDPRKILLDEAENWAADSIMVGAKGHRILERILIGTVSTSITARAQCSVEIVR
jgi:nucleotide-binding universal stress UspA family protein